MRNSFLAVLVVLLVILLGSCEELGLTEDADDDEGGDEAAGIEFDGTLYPFANTYTAWYGYDSSYEAYNIDFYLTGEDVTAVADSEDGFVFVGEDDILLLGFWFSEDEPASGTYTVVTSSDPSAGTIADSSFIYQYGDPDSNDINHTVTGGSVELTVDDDTFEFEGTLTLEADSPGTFSGTAELEFTGTLNEMFDER